MKFSKRRLTPLLGFSIVLYSLAAWAQFATTGQMTGTVSDPSGAAIPGATVTITNQATAESRTASSEPTGEYSFLTVVPGTYTLSVDATGFAKATAQNVLVLVGQTTVQNVQLVVGGAKQQVTVSGAAPLIQSSSSEVGGVIERHQIASLPLKNRDFTDLATLVPQIVRTPPIDPTKTRVGEISVAGTGGRETNVFVDGFENFDFVVGGLGYDVSPDAIQEFNVLTNNFSAEQARSVGAVVNIVERSGTNKLHGDAFYFFRNQALTARDFFQTEKSTFRRQQQGGSIGGPLKKDKIFGFVAFEDHRELDTGIVNTRGVYPQFDGNVPLPFRRDFVTAKLDVSPTEKNHFFYRFNIDNFNAAENVGGIRVESNGENNLTNTQAHAFSDTYILSPSKVNTFGFQFFRYDNTLAPFSTIPQQTRPDLILGQRAGDPQGTNEKRYQIKDDFGLTAGSHSVRFGGEYHYVQGSAFFQLGTNGAFQFFTDAPLDSQFADLLLMSACSTPNCNLGSSSTGIAGLYIQDDWKIKPNLTLNLGLRWDYFSNAFDKNFDGALGLLAPPGSRSSDKNNFAPRIGFAYDPFKNGKFVVRGGYGIYYENINFLTTLLERGFDGRNIGLNVFVNPGGININNPFPGLSPDQIHALFFQPPISPNQELANNLATPYLQYSTAGIQWSFAPNWVFSLTGVHSLGIKGLIGRDINVDPSFNVATAGSPLCQMFGAAVCTQFGPVPWISNGDHLHYNALVVAVTKALAHRFQLNGSYTLSKATDETDDSTGTSLVSNPFNFAQDSGPAQTDQRHRMILSGIFDPSHLPPFFGNGWQISLISTFTTPLPFDITEASPQPDGSTPIRPPGIGRNAGARGSQSQELQLINSYRASLGMEPLNRPLVPRSLNIRSTDLSISKAFTIREPFRLEVRGEGYNLFNSTNFVSNSGMGGAAAFGFSGVNGTAESNQIGLPSSTLGVLADGGPRAFQLSVKVNW
ncbi:MAG TPA: TonB-dependent receptor [Terriglobales bacterium]|nr:TonB-dependent receptor [Terriglobales bacterium]HXF13454.1 TonB-dependent receptor [Terriglobales bacterium]